MLFSFGSNGSGQLGLGHDEDVSIPTKCIVSAMVSPPSQLAAGGNHTIILAASGETSGTGSSHDGRCGYTLLQGDSAAESKDKHKFQTSGIGDSQQHQHRECSMVAATWEATILVSMDRKHVYSCGSGSKGQLGQGLGIVNSPQAISILNLEATEQTVVDVAAGMSHAVVVLSDGKIYGWGVGRTGQLGNAKGSSWAPCLLEGIPFKATRAVCGREFTYVVSSPSEGKHIILGTNKWKVQSTAPASVENWIEIGASWGSIFVLLDSGTLFGWGRNDHGQLPPAGLPLIVRFAAGSEHVIAETQSGDLIAWGWGEHGNCGLPTAPNGDVADRWNVLPRLGAVKFLGAGCATSWVCFEDT